MAFVKRALQVAWELAPVTFVCFVLFLRWGIYEYPLAAIVAFIDLIEHIILNRGWYFVVIKNLGVASLLLYLASRWILLAYTIIGREHKKMNEEIQRLRENNARLEDTLKVSRSETENMRNCRDSTLDDYSVQSATLTTMTDRAVTAECRLAETMNELELATETVAKVTRYSDLCESTKEFLLLRLKGYDNCKADVERYKCEVEHYKRVAKRCKGVAERYKCDAERYKRDADRYKCAADRYKADAERYESCKADAERYKCDAERYKGDAGLYESCKADSERYRGFAVKLKRGMMHFKEEARIAEEKCSANLLQFDDQKKALEKQVEALKEEVRIAEADCSANLFDFDDQKKALEEQVEALKAEVQAGLLGKAGEEKAKRGEDKSGHLEIANMKKIKVLERKIEELEMDIENLKDSERTTKAAFEMEIKGFNATISDLKRELEDNKEELDGYKEDNDERSKTIQGLLGLKKQQEKELVDVKKQLELANLAIKFGISKSNGNDGDAAASPSNPPSGADSSGAVQPGPSNVPSTSGTNQAPGNLSNFFGNSPLLPAPPIDPSTGCPQS